MDDDDQDSLAFRLYVGRHAPPAEQLTHISLDDLPEIPSEEAPRPLSFPRHAKDADKHVHFGLDTTATPLRVVIPSEPYTAPSSAVSAASSVSVYSQPDSAASEDDSLLHIPYVRPTLEARSSLEVYPPHRRIVPHVFIKSPVSPATRSAVESLLREPCPALDEVDSFDEGAVPDIMPGAWFSPHIGAEVQEEGESDDESEGPITPETYAVAPDVTIEDVPELCLEMEDGRVAKSVDAVVGKRGETRDVGLLERIAAWSVDCA